MLIPEGDLPINFISSFKLSSLHQLLLVKLSQPLDTVDVTLSTQLELLEEQVEVGINATS